jgi:hypothetical protein
VKSNAKRFARGIAAKYPAMYSPAEPVPVEEGAREWFPALTIIGEEFEAVKAEVRATCVMVNEDEGAEPEVVKVEVVATEEEVAAGILKVDVTAPATIDVRDFGARGSIFDGGKRGGKQAIVDDITEQMLDQGKTVVVVRRDGFEVRGAGAAKDVTPKAPADIAAMAASLPPRQTSTPEEIQKRRAERRAAIEADKASGSRDRLGRKVEPEKISKKKTIIDLVGRENGATQEELEAATGWQRHTLRGYIAGTLRKIMRTVGRDIECRRAKGEATRYVMVTAKEGGA